MADQNSTDHPDHAHRRALLKALAVAPVILTVSTVGARAAYGSVMGGNRPCSNLIGLPAEEIPPECRRALGL